ncbi:sodium- and chloride-dependent glycine transporter 2-like isoform X2 [Calliphora vicina]|uniref:sodium- and chloride-dependent glycine transporter 2-like isoform X2 n=1 Tax=Calliphora vicina TaxID=7373 RepID=UPI00325A8E3F
MVYETSYESGRTPFIPDTKRGYWANPYDFVYAGLGLAFRLDVFTWFYLMQLSGIGYVSLALNICVVSYYSIFAMVPLVYMFASMQPTLPWGCEGLKNWTHKLTEREKINVCNLYVQNETDHTYKNIFYNHHIPSVLYFKTLFNDINLFKYGSFAKFFMSWQLLVCAIIVWTVAIIIFYKFFNTERFGQIIRYTVWILLGLLVLLIIRFSFLHNSGAVYARFFTLTWSDITNGFASIPVYGLTAFGPGWGIFITLSSFNKFKTNIMKQSWFIGLGQMLIVIGLDLLSNLTRQHFSELTNFKYFSDVEYLWVLYLSPASVMSHMEWANLWTILYYFMLFLSGMLLIITQLFTILTTIFDEFAALRERKAEVCMGLIAATAAISLYFTSNHGVIYFVVLLTDTYITQTLINLVLLLIVLWIYGRERFQRDIEFMINERFSTWKINFLRFVAPLGMLMILLYGFVLAFFGHLASNIVIAVFALIFIIIPWLLIPVYVVYAMRHGMGSFKTRFQRSCRPNDWYPVEQEDRQCYEEAMCNMDITHQLNEITDNDISSI